MKVKSIISAIDKYNRLKVVLDELQKLKSAIGEYYDSPEIKEMHFDDEATCCIEAIRRLIDDNINSTRERINGLEVL